MKYEIYGKQNRCLHYSIELISIPYTKKATEECGNYNDIPFRRSEQDNFEKKRAIQPYT